MRGTGPRASGGNVFFGHFVVSIRGVSRSRFSLENAEKKILLYLIFVLCRCLR